ncbi:aldehyde dehydrogenase family protein [Congzhengia minquanensis]|uniref:Aldehyde dehydrogenase EutE n=1 Tax=Congzhengia minquanensis TaxID=2763657 RepID=A0A926DMJ7_9FIRM|nr:aldehyde dehydrogenase family protein [Congzhengia minquanensis]MBC8540457.1 aldehyde dehydrogenase EutE [Congzhengia minquanensis]
MELNENYINQIVQNVVKNLENAAPQQRLKGVFDSMTDALEAVNKAYQFYRSYSIAQREKMIANIRKLTLEEAETLAKLGVEETGMGRVSDKIIKHQLVANKTPGTEDLKPTALTGDDGLTLVEMAPFGVIGSITPSTNPSETVICNSIGMIAGGNGVVFNPHPNACRTANYAVDLVNRAIVEAGGPENLVVSVAKPTMDTSKEMMASPIVRMLVATGGPGVVRTLLSSGKKAIGAGAGNPPVIVDDTADVAKAGRDIVLGASFDNNLPCIAEKECFAFSNIADELIDSMIKNGAYMIDGDQVERLKKIALIEKDGKFGINKKWVGKDASLFLKELGIDSDAKLIICETDEMHPFVQVEMMMPILAIVRVNSIEEAIKMAVNAEHGNRHSAHIHSKNIDHLTAFAKAVETTIFVKNAPSYAGIGAGGEGYTTFTIAGPTGEGLTAAHSFTRARRCVMVDGLHII